MTAFWEIVAGYQVNVYLDRVPTDSNISDGMSRSRLDELDTLSWTRVYPDLQSVVGCNAEIRKKLGFVRTQAGVSWTLYRKAKKPKTESKGHSSEGAGARPGGPRPKRTPGIQSSGARTTRASRGSRAPSGTAEQ